MKCLVTSLKNLAATLALTVILKESPKMLFIILVFVSVFFQSTPKSICEPGRSCSGGDQCIITLTANVSASVTYCRRLENAKYVLSWSDENVFILSRSEYYDVKTSTWTTSSIFSYMLEELIEGDSIFYCSLEEERCTKAKREAELPGGNCDCKTRVTIMLFLFLLIGFSVIIAFGAYVMLNCKGFLKVPVDNAFHRDPRFQYLKRSVRPNHRLSYADKSSELLNDMQLLQKIEPLRIVYFIGKAGSGKTCLFQKILRNWNSGKILKKYTLMYFQINDLTNEGEELIGKVDFFLRHFKATLRFQQLIVILDGVDIPLLERLIQTVFHKFEGVKLWIGCREKGKTIRDTDHRVNFEYCAVNLLEAMFQKLVSVDNFKHSVNSPQEVWDKYEIVQKPFEQILSYPVMARLLTLIYLCDKETLDKQIDAVCKFPSGNTVVKTKAVESLIECGSWDVLACLIESFTKDEEEHTTYVKQLNGKEMAFKRIDCDYLRQAVLHLCHKMKIEKREATSLQIHSGDPTFLEGYLPNIEKELIFCKTVMHDDVCFSSLIKTASESCKKIQFRQSELPETVSVQNISEIKDVTVTRTRNDGNYSLDFKKGTWAKTVEAHGTLSSTSSSQS